MVVIMEMVCKWSINLIISFKASKECSDIFIILLLWKITNYLGIWSDYILPSPEKVYSTFLNMISDGSIFINVYASMKRVLIGFAISTAIGVPLGIFFGIYSGVYEYFKSLINF